MDTNVCLHSAMHTNIMKPIAGAVNAKYGLVTMT
jgi:hypothetical protein